jgi:hypothetical protein
MKATLEFEFPKDEINFDAAINAHAYRIALKGVIEYLTRESVYSSSDLRKEWHLELKDEMFKICKKNGLSKFL